MPADVLTKIVGFYNDPATQDALAAPVDPQQPYADAGLNDHRLSGLMDLRLVSTALCFQATAALGDCQFYCACCHQRKANALAKPFLVYVSLCFVN